MSLTMNVAHGLLMLVAWGILLPAGVWIGRNTKERGDEFWLVWHRRLQIGGLVLATLGFAIAKGWFSGHGHHGRHDNHDNHDHAHGGFSHASSGTALMVVCWLQPLNALLRPHAGGEARAKSGARKAWELVHKGAGWLAIACAPVQIVSGLYEIEASTGFVVAYVVWAYICLALFVFAKNLKRVHAATVVVRAADVPPPSAAQ